MRGPWALLVLTALTACSPAKPVAVAPAPPVRPEIRVTERLAEADALVRAGCLDCLISAFTIYDALRTVPGVDDVAADRAARTAVLAGLRERELGIEESGYFARAQPLAGANESLKGALGPILEIAETMPSRPPAGSPVDAATQVSRQRRATMNVDARTRAATNTAFMSDSLTDHLPAENERDACMSRTRKPALTAPTLTDWREMGKSLLRRKGDQTMPMSIPPTLRMILQDKAYAHVITRNASGAPQVSMTWVDVEGDEVLVNTNDARMKTLNLKRDPRVIVSVQDRNNPQSYAIFYGRVNAIVDDVGNAHIDKLSKRFLGLDKYQSRVPGERRVIIRISVNKIGGFAPGYQPWV